MPPRPALALLAALLLAGTVPARAGSTPAATADVAPAVRAFLDQVARDVTAEGPKAWSRHLSGGPEFYMVVAGRMEFASPEEAASAIAKLTGLLVELELRWGSEVRIEPLGPDLAAVAAPYFERRRDASGRAVEESGYLTGLVERGPADWRFRNLHWSMAGAPPAVP